jgi:elongation factor Ts
MTAVTAAMVKELRDKTDAGMMDAKNALVECNGNMEEAVDYLRKKGLSKAAKKSGRTAAEGLIAVASSRDHKEGAVVEVNAETDFVARNQHFQDYTTKVAELSFAANSSVKKLAETHYADGKNAQEYLTNMIATIGENMSLRRCDKLSVSEGYVATYIHNAVAPNLGKIGVLVALESSAPADVLATLGKQLAMHVAAANPQFLDTSSVDPAAAERERNVQRETALASGKPADIVEKMLDGRMRKYFEEVCFTEQAFIMDPESKISAVIEKAAKAAGTAIKLTGFIRYQLGEGIEVEVKDFASEVASVVNG